MSQPSQVTITQSAKTVKIKTNVRGLDVLSSVYAFSMALGLTQVFIGSQAFLTRILSGTAPLSDEKTFIILMLFANIALLGLRFFWVPRNLQSLVITAARAEALAPNATNSKDQLSNISIAFHLVLIFLHGALFYLICAEFEFITFVTSSNLPLNSSVFFGYIIMHTSLLLLNAVWIAMIRRQELRLEERIYQGNSKGKLSAGNVWWRNNLVASLCVLAPFALSSTCRSVELQCIRQSVESTREILTLFPTSPQVLAAFYYEIEKLFAHIGLITPYLPVYGVLVVLLINSAYDLFNAGRFYVFFEDVEWEETIHGAEVKGPIER